MKTKEEKTSIIFRTHRTVLEIAKYYAKKENRSLNNYIETLLKREVKMDYPISKNRPNQETKKAIEEARNGKGLTKVETIEYLFKDLDSWFNVWDTLYYQV